METRQGRDSLFSSLGPNVLVEVLSFLTYDSARLAWFCNLCQGVRLTLSDDSAWRHLCKKYWYATDERIKDWPTLSPRGLYRVLEHWTPWEGYYVLTPAFPWGLLVLIRIVEGCLKAKVIRFVPRTDGIFEEVHIPLFEVTFSDGEDGTFKAAVKTPAFEDASVQLSRPSLRSLKLFTPIAKYCFQSDDISRLFPAHRILRVSQMSSPDASSRFMLDAGYSKGAPAEEPPIGYTEDEDNEESDNEDDERYRIWDSGDLSKSFEEVQRQTMEMLRFMFVEKRVPCDLALIRSPDEFVPQSSTFPGVRPGLYVGDYGHQFYGQFRPEVLLLEYKVLTGAELALEMSTPTCVFNRPRGEPAPESLHSILNFEGPITFMRGIKQCGDFHVPMGATTFVAVCGPPEVCEALASELTAEAACPRMVANRASGRDETVNRAWRGFGTLSMPGFKGPSWATGWLVQLDNDDNGGHRFGFAWDRNQDAIVLRWVDAQDASPFLQRAWLPEDLQ